MNVLKPVKDALKRESRLKVSDICRRTGLAQHQVRAAVSKLVTQGHAVRHEDGTYSLYVPPKREEPGDDIRIAQKITVGRGSYWGAGLA